MRGKSAQNDPHQAFRKIQTQVSDLLRNVFALQPVRKITDKLEEERRRRRLLILIGVPAQILFFGVGLAYPNSNYGFIELIPLVLLLWFFSLGSLNVTIGPDDRIRTFLAATNEFRVQRSVRNDITGDRVRVLLKEKYRRVRWPVPVLILEQRWKKTTDQLFLVIGPEFHWWSGGSVWSPWHWKCGKNGELKFSKSADVSHKAYSIKFQLPGGLEWPLRFKSAAARDQAYEALIAIREAGRSRDTDVKKPTASERQGSKKTENKKAKDDFRQDQTDKTAESRRRESTAGNKPWHEVLGTAPNASPEEIKVAYLSAIKKCHPDTVADRSVLIQKAAAAESEQINVAYDNARIARGF
ncbi:DnaJ-domain-containing protein 1 [Bradyrhizobium sp. USDA 4341]